MESIGKLTWAACEQCDHYRPEKGGCEPLDEGYDTILFIDIAAESVMCLAYTPAKK